mmetsp:Transcript_68148/g.112097  ORF Transcript_68148/g.112097 Transcript_68148/m.112097 type:complete len:219 (+) Transcript_68148:238-894(+)
MLLRDAWDVGCAGQTHHHLKFILQHVHHSHDAVHAIGGKGVQDWAANAHSLCSQCNGFEDVSTAANTTINEHSEGLLGGTSLLQGFHDFWQNLDAGAASVQLSSTVVRQDAARQARLESHHGILRALHAFQQDLHLGNALQPRHVLPVESRIDVAADGTCSALRTINCSFIFIVALHIRALLSELVAHVLLTTSQLRSIHGHEQCLDACLLKLGDVLL